MYKRILITGRADCAVRLIRACHDEGVQAFVVCARDDALSAVIDAADGVVYTGMSREAYLSQDDILEAARACDCEAVLPGWGFLSEDFAFARRCRAMGLHFIGPTSRQLQIFGDKLQTIAALLGKIPDDTVPCDAADARERLSRLGGPYMLKGRYGGGGKEIERFENYHDLACRLDAIAQTHALQRFYVEPALDGASHIEFQVFGDGRGDVQIVGARDCTPQRRHQKYLETSLDIATLRPDLKAQMDAVRARLCAMRYQGWGTVEFLVGDRIHLLELNPRLQVEHGVTEMTAGIDLVRTAIRTSCFGVPSIVTIPVAGRHAVEFRLFAESAGTVRSLGFDGHAWPDFPTPHGAHCRIETAYRPGDRITGVYDGLVARFMLATDAPNAHAMLDAWMASFQMDFLEA